MKLKPQYQNVVFAADKPKWREDVLRTLDQAAAAYEAGVKEKHPDAVMWRNFKADGGCVTIEVYASYSAAEDAPGIYWPVAAPQHQGG